MNETKESIYDEISWVLMNYENGLSGEVSLYDMLVKIRDRWEDVITAINSPSHIEKSTSLDSKAEERKDPYGKQIQSTAEEQHLNDNILLAVDGTGETVFLNKSKFEKYLKEDIITEFVSPKDCQEWFNTYDYQNFKTPHEMKTYQGEYGFGVGEKWYHINFDEALDIYMESKEIERFSLSLGDIYIPSLMGEVEENAWYGKEPTTICIVAGENEIKIQGYTYEPSYECFSTASSIHFNGKELYGKDSRCVGSYKYETYDTGSYSKVEDALAFVREQCQGLKFSIVSKEKESLDCKIEEAGAKVSDAQEKEPKKSSQEHSL